MYDTDQMIDYIRELEKSAGHVYITTVAGVTDDGESWGTTLLVTSYIPSVEEIEEVIKTHIVQYEYSDNYLDYADICDDEDCDCDDKALSLDEYIENHVDIKLNARFTTWFESIETNRPDTHQTSIGAGYYGNDQADSYGDVTICRMEIKKNG